MIYDENGHAQIEPPEIPTELIIHYIVKDYQRLFRERSILIHYIRQMEKIYEESKVGMVRLSTRKKSSRNRIRQELCLLAYNIIKEHLDAQKQLREELGKNDYELGTEFDKLCEHNYTLTTRRHTRR